MMWLFLKFGKDFRDKLVSELKSQMGTTTTFEKASLALCIFIKITLLNNLKYTNHSQPDYIHIDLGYGNQKKRRN